MAFYKNLHLLFLIQCLIISGGLPDAHLLPRLSVLTALGGTSARNPSGVTKHLWTAWSSWSACSATCGESVKIRRRECVGRQGNSLVRLDNPECPGDRREVSLCQNQACASDALDPRESQCQQQRHTTVQGRTYDWISFHTGGNPCELTCLAKGYSFLYNFGHVSDGTSCGDDLRVCVAGQCLGVACDGFVGSHAVPDMCHVCDGRNTSCRHVTGTHLRMRAETDKRGYTKVVRIPAGASHLHISDNSQNFIALADVRGTYIINGNWLIDWPGKYDVAGTSLVYSRSHDHNESLAAEGPTREDLILYIIFRDNNLALDYEYWIPEETYRDFEAKLEAEERAISVASDTPPVVGVSESLAQDAPHYDAISSFFVDQAGNEDSYFQSLSDLNNDLPADDSVNELNVYGFVEGAGHKFELRQSGAVAHGDKSNAIQPIGAVAHGGKSNAIQPIVPGRGSQSSERKTKKHRKKSDKTDTGVQCSKCKRTKNRSKNFCSADFVIHGRVTDLLPQTNSTRYELAILHTYRATFPLMDHEFIVVPGSCGCPGLVWDREYLMLGHLAAGPDQRGLVLQVTAQDYTRRYSPTNHLRMEKLAKRKTCPEST